MDNIITLQRVIVFCLKTFWMWIAGVALAVILSGVRHISDTVFLEAAKVWSQCYVFLLSIFQTS